MQKNSLFHKNFIRVLLTPAELKVSNYILNGTRYIGVFIASFSRNFTNIDVSFHVEKDKCTAFEAVTDILPTGIKHNPSSATVDGGHPVGYLDKGISILQINKGVF